MTLLVDPPIVALDPEAPAPPARGPRRPSWLRGWKVPVRLARRDLRRRPGRTVLVALLVAVPVTALVLMSVTYRTDQTNDGAWITQTFGAADAIASVSLAPAESNCVDCATRADIEAALPEGTRQLWATQAEVPLRAPVQSRSWNGGVSNVDPTDPLLKGAYSLADGSWPSADNEVALRSDLADLLDVALGDEFSLAHQTRTFEVVGLIDRAGWHGASLIAPGFDFSVVRPRNTSEIGAFDLPASYDATDRTFESTIGGALQVRPGSNGTFNYTVTEQAAVDQSLILGWLGGVLAMSVLGVVIAAAFAISGRRQLVAVGQLSASGAGQSTLVRTFGLYGALTGAVGVAVGFLAAVPIYRARPEWFGDGNATIAWLDMFIIASTAIAVATIAALAPTRSLTKVSVLSALAGRRPVGAVPGWLTRAGAALFVGGVLVTLIATRSGANGGGREAGMLVAVGMIAAVLGVCALAPWIIDHLGALVSRRGGSVRLAARSMTRHRPRAAAVLASLLVVGMAATGVAAAAENQVQKEEAERATTMFTRKDLVWVQSSSFGPVDNGTWSSTPLTLADPRELRAEAEGAIGPASWTSASLAYQPNRTDLPEGNPFALVATGEVNDLLDLTTQTRAVIADAVGPVALTRYVYGESGPSAMVTTEPEFDLPWPLISPKAAQAEGWSVVQNAVEFGVADHDLASEEVTALMALSVDDGEGLAYLGLEQVGTSTQWSLSSYIYDSDSFRLTSSQVRLIVLGVSLLLVMLLVSIGMALWAVESRAERDVLVAVGASPSTLARVAGWRAGGLTLGAMLIAVPMGLLVSWAITRAAHGSIAVPWLLAALLLFAVPVVIGVGALACSRLAQKIRPVRMSTLTID